MDRKQHGWKRSAMTDSGSPNSTTTLSWRWHRGRTDHQDRTRDVGGRAFSRNPMSMAVQAHDLNAFLGGRLVLGLGSQVKPHIERRFSMPWHKAARQMREFIEAMKAIFDCWYEGERLEYQGEYYQHTLMPATFTPDNIEGPRPRIALSATGPLMTRVAAEIADGMIMHPFSSEKYIREVTLPAVEEGLRTSGRSLSEFELDYAPLIATGVDEEAVLRAVANVRDRIAFLRLYCRLPASP
ncbi:MAG: hypothetical protein CM1200mP9_11940 [Gammaproteobacteria bacterium]|nr:MAG: hypothetical protein CM1200mP9_11940 [Gammaproteobacteria bacterium]